MYNKLRKTFGCYFFAFICLSLQTSASDKEETYVFYRGHHFLVGQVIDNAIFASRGISSRPVSNGDILAPQFKNVISKIQTLHRSWTEEEKIEFKSLCDTPYQQLVELYTNTYAKFIDELDEENSNTRKILKLAGLENITSNFFISTSLKSEQACKYGSGLKLYKDADLRRYPSYSKVTFKPQNQIIGFVDVIVIPKKEIQNTSAFFVVDSFATGCTKLSYHFSKNLTEEMEVLFPFYISEKYHVDRLPITLPSLKGISNIIGGLLCSHWTKKLAASTSKEDKKTIETNLIKSRISTISDCLDKKLTQELEKNKKIQVYNGPYLAGLDHALIPSDAIVMRKEIIDHEQKITSQYFNETIHQFTIPIGELSFALSHTLKRVAKSDYPITILANFSMKSINFGLMEIFLSEDAVVKLKFQGDPINLQSLCKQFFALDFRKNDVDEEANALWFNPDRSIIPNFKKILSSRKNQLIVDVSSLALAPGYLETNTNILNFVDNEREEVNDAFNWIIDGADHHADQVREHLYG